MSSILSDFEPFLARAWQLDVAPMVEVSYDSSHFAGQPYAIESDKWPICKICKFGMVFCLQVNLPSQCSVVLGISGLVELFFCPRCFVDGTLSKDICCVRHYENPNSGSFVHMPVEHKIKTSPVNRWLANVKWEFEPRTINIGQEWVELPYVDELAAKILKQADKAEKTKWTERFADRDWYDPVFDAVEELRAGLQTASHLGGYPGWQNGYHEIKCKSCRQEMNFLLQVESDGLGDGNGLLFYCKRHPDSFEFFFSTT
jgi:hypothetical protein